MIETPLIIKAREFAKAAHESINQKREYTGAPYYTHVFAVAELVSRVMPDNENAICAAYLHDVLEDTPIGKNEILNNFGDDITYIVHALTHEFTSEKYPDWNRKKRKTKEAERLGDFGYSCFGMEIHSAKLADLTNNTSGKDSIVKYNSKFAKVYLEEKEYLLRLLYKGHRILIQKAWESLNWGLEQLAKPEEVISNPVPWNEILFRNSTSLSEKLENPLFPFRTD